MKRTEIFCDRCEKPILENANTSCNGDVRFSTNLHTFGCKPTGYNVQFDLCTICSVHFKDFLLGVGVLSIKELKNDRN